MARQLAGFHSNIASIAESLEGSLLQHDPRHLLKSRARPLAERFALAPQTSALDVLPQQGSTNQRWKHPIGAGAVYTAHERPLPMKMVSKTDEESRNVSLEWLTILLPRVRRGRASRTSSSFCTRSIIHSAAKGRCPPFPDVARQPEPRMLPERRRNLHGRHFEQTHRPVRSHPAPDTKRPRITPGPFPRHATASARRFVLLAVRVLGGPCV